jgi:hypothetical protein
MKTNRKKWMLGLGIPLGLLATFAAFTACKGFGLHGCHGMMTPERVRQMIDWKFDDVMDSITATDDQRVKLGDIKEKLINEAIDLHRDLKDSHDVILDEWKSTSPDLGTIYNQIDSGLIVKKDFARKVAGALLEVHEILTPQQRDLITEQVEEHMTHLQEFLKTK